MKEVQDLIYSELDKIRKEGFAQNSSFTSTSTLERIGNELGLEHLKRVLSNKQLVKTAISPLQVIPEFLIQFISLIVNGNKPKSIFDPWLTRDSFPIRCGIKNYSGFCFGLENELLTKGLLQDENKILSCDGLNRIPHESNTFDLIISFPPLGMNSPTGEFKLRDYASNLFLESAKKINEGGLLVFLMPPKFVFDKIIKQAVIEADISIDGIFYLEEGSHYPLTSIGSYLVVATKGENTSTFTAKLSTDSKTNEIIYNNYCSKKEGYKIQLGKIVDYNEFSSFIALEEFHNLNNIGRKTGLSLSFIRDYIKDKNGIKTIKTDNPEDVEHIPNSIYIPKVGNSDVVTNPSDFNIKPNNYLQVVLDKNTNSIFLANYLNTSIGRMSRDSRKVGTSINSITVSTLKEIPLFIPDYQNQLKLIDVDNKIDKIRLELNELKDNLWRRPKMVNEIDKEISEFEKDNSLEKWLDMMPFPLSSILWKYYATSNSRNKVEHLLHFFEAFSEFLSLIMLSSLNQNKEFYKSERYRWISTDIRYQDWIKKASFGGWNILTASLAKATRTLMNDKDKKEILLSCFGNPSVEFMNFMTSKKVFPILEEVREFRNKWKGHGGISSEQEDSNRVTLLEQKLNSLRQEIKDSFSTCKLISPDSSKYKNGVFHFKVRELTGNRTPFNETEIESLIPLDENKLYLTHENQNKPIELLPFIKYNHESKACYFYSSIESSDIRFVSFHFEKDSVYTELLDEKFEEVLQILRQEK